MIVKLKQRFIKNFIVERNNMIDSSKFVVLDVETNGLSSERDDLLSISIYKPDIALLPIGDKFTMGPFEAALASMWLNPKVVIPMHYNTFPPIEQDPAIFSNFVSQFNPNIDVVVMNPDEYFEYNPEDYQD